MTITVVAARFAYLFLDSATPIAMYYLPYETEEVKKTKSIKKKAQKKHKIQLTNVISVAIVAA